MKSQQKKHTILWADDDTDDLELFREVLQEIDQDHKIIEAHNGNEVLHYLNKCEKESLPCLIVLDMNMPVLSGRETLAILKREKNFQSLPVVVFTTSSSPLDKLFCERFNTELVTKPPTYEKLKEIIPSFLKQCDRAVNKNLSPIVNK